MQVKHRLAAVAPLVEHQPVPPGSDPLLHNKTVAPYLRGEEYVRRLQRLILSVQERNAALAPKT